MMLPRTILLLLVLLTPFRALAVEVTISLTAPRGAPLVAPDLVSLSIEQDRWVDWVGTTERNRFFYNALDNLVDITNSPPFIRIGADSEDHTLFSSAVQYEEDIFPASTPVVPYPEATNITVGQGFYDIISHLPFGSRVHWGINLRQSNLTAAYLETKALVQAFGSSAVKDNGITLNFIEIGNEADLYRKHGARESCWDVSDYVYEWVEFATNVSKTASLSENSFTKLIGGAFAFSSHDDITGFSPQAIFANGILDSAPGALITAISQHHYSGSFCTGSGAVLQDLMAKNYIRGNISMFDPDIEATYHQDLEYFLGETNSMSCHGAPGVSNSAGAALWALDYSLFATQVGITRLHFHEGIGYKYNFIQPVTLNYSILDGSPITPLPPHIQPPYYAAIIAAETIGSSNTTQIAEIDVDTTDVSGYAVYEYGNLVRAVFINTVAYLPGTGVRTTTHIDINFSEFGLAQLEAPQVMEVKRLEISYADATSGITWAGRTYETADARVSGPLKIEKIDVSQGLDIQGTEAVLLSFFCTSSTA